MIYIHYIKMPKYNKKVTLSINTLKVSFYVYTLISHKQRLRRTPVQARRMTYIQRTRYIRNIPFSVRWCPPRVAFAPKLRINSHLTLFIQLNRTKNYTQIYKMNHFILTMYNYLNNKLLVYTHNFYIPMIYTIYDL